MELQVTIKSALLAMGIISATAGIGLVLWGPELNALILAAIVSPAVLIGFGLAGGFLLGLHKSDYPDK